MFSGCGSKKHIETGLTIHQVYTKCPAPETPTYEPFVDEYITSPKNYEILMGNVLKMKNHNVELLRSLQCYELQAR